MGRELSERFPAAAQTLSEADEALGYSITKLCFEGPEDQLRLTENTQPAILAVSVAVARVLGEHGIEPSFAAGHSLGEWSAHVAAGTLSFADAVRSVHLRGRAMQQAVPAGMGAMAAVLTLTADRVAELCAEAARETGESVQAANLNSPGQTVISGAKAAVEKAAELCKANGARRAVMLPVSAPFHCPMMQPAQEEVARVLSGITLSDPRIPVAANVTGALVSTAAEAKDRLIHQVTGAVRWIDCVNALVAAGAEVFVEVGPGKVLCGLLKQINPELKSCNVDSLASLEPALAILKA